MKHNCRTLALAALLAVLAAAVVAAPLFGDAATAEESSEKTDLTITVSIENWTYGDKANEPTVTGNSGDGKVTYTYAVEGSDEFGSEVPENAGNYTVKVEVAETESYKAGEGKANFTIAKANITLSVTIEDWIYGGTASEPSVTGNLGDGTVAYSYAVKDTTDFAAAAPTDAGDYTVKAVVAETANYKGAEATADFAIAKAGITLSVSINGWTYGEEAKTPTVEGNTGNGTVTYTYAAASSNEFGPEVPENAGNYKVKAVVGETANYNGAEATKDFAIAKADITPIVTIEDWTYGGTASEPSVTGNLGDGTVAYSYAVKGTTDFAAAAPTDAGDYTVKAVVAETANYNGAEATADFTIYKAPLSISVSIADWTAGDEPSEPAVEGNLGEGEVTYSYSVAGVQAFVPFAPTEIGDYTVKAVVAETANYLGAEATADFSIAKRAAPSAEPGLDDTMLYIAAVLVCVLGLAGAVLYLRRR